MSEGKWRFCFPINRCGKMCRPFSCLMRGGGVRSLNMPDNLHRLTALFMRLAMASTRSLNTSNCRGSKATLRRGMATVSLGARFPDRTSSES